MFWSWTGKGILKQAQARSISSNKQAKQAKHFGIRKIIVFFRPHSEGGTRCKTQHRHIWLVWLDSRTPKAKSKTYSSCPGFSCKRCAVSRNSLSLSDCLDGQRLLSLDRDPHKELHNIVPPSFRSISGFFAGHPVLIIHVLKCPSYEP